MLQRLTIIWIFVRDASTQFINNFTSTLCHTINVAVTTHDIGFPFFGEVTFSVFQRQFVHVWSTIRRLWTKAYESLKIRANRFGFCIIVRKIVRIVNVHLSGCKSDLTIFDWIQQIKKYSYAKAKAT